MVELCAHLQIEASFGKFAEQIANLPPLPTSLQRLIEVMDDENAAPSELEELIRYDPSLTSKVLHIANSAYFGLRGKIASLSRAILVLGANEVKSICLCTLLSEHCFSRHASRAPELGQLWKHAMLCAKIACAMVQHRPWIKREKAYLLGLLHDLGRLVLFTYFPEEYRAMGQVAREGGMSLWEAESACGLTHTRVGKWVARRWGFPEVYPRVMAYHHTPEEAPALDPVVLLVYLADLLANGSEAPGWVEGESVEACCRGLFISREEWEGYGRSLPALRSEVEELWRWLW